MTYLARNYSTKKTPQSEPIPGKDQKPNNAGGYSFWLKTWDKLDRFLILGCEGGSYYSSERKLTKENAESVIKCIDEDYRRAVDRIVEISRSGRAPKNDPAIFALALAISFGSLEAKRYAASKVSDVCRIGTHIFHLAAYIDELRGWGRIPTRTVARWYTERSSDSLAQQVVKYQSRDGFSHRDLLRLAHPKSSDPVIRDIFNWVTKGWTSIGVERPESDALAYIWAFERLKRLVNDENFGKKTISAAANLIGDYKLPREAVPTEFLKHPSIWEVLLLDMPMEAMTRNLATMTRVGILAPLSDGTKLVAGRLGDVDRIHRARLHPIKLLSALKTYESGKGVRSSNSWEPVGEIVKALDAAFYLAFKNVTPTEKNIVLALDVSASMAAGSVAGVHGLTPRVASAAMALVTANVEPHCEIMAFAHEFMPLKIWAGMSLSEAVDVVSNLYFGGTDCALPMLWAEKNGLKNVDSFIVYTDSETWYGQIHPTQALRSYRKFSERASKLVVVGMVSNDFSLADPDDSGQLDVVGMDTSTPDVISEFVRNL